jgi:hypothetical protein
VSPAKPILIEKSHHQYDDVGARSGGKVEQVNQARLAHIGGNKLGSEFDGINKKSQITRGGRTKTNLLGEDVSTAHHVQSRRIIPVETDNAPSEGKDLRIEGWKFKGHGGDGGWWME